MQIKGKIKQRYDTLSNRKSDDIVFLRGERVAIDCSNQTRLKIRNGINAFTQMPFVDKYALNISYVATSDINQSARANYTPFGLASGQRLSTN